MMYLVTSEGGRDSVELQPGERLKGSRREAQQLGCSILGHGPGMADPTEEGFCSLDPFLV